MASFLTAFPLINQKPKSLSVLPFISDFHAFTLPRRIQSQSKRAKNPSTDPKQKIPLKRILFREINPRKIRRLIEHKHKEGYSLEKIYQEIDDFGSPFRLKQLRKRSCCCNECGFLTRFEKQNQFLLGIRQNLQKKVLQKVQAHTLCTNKKIENPYIRKSFRVGQNAQLLSEFWSFTQNSSLVVPNPNSLRKDSEISQGSTEQNVENAPLKTDCKERNSLALKSKNPSKRQIQNPKLFRIPQPILQERTLATLALKNGIERRIS